MAIQSFLSNSPLRARFTRQLRYKARYVYLFLFFKLINFNFFLLQQVFTLELLNTTGGANLGRFPVTKITVPSNDGPYGVVAFASPLSTTIEVANNGTSTAMLTVTRRYDNKYDEGMV